MVRIVVACGGGIFTTSIVSEEIEDICKKQKIKYTLTPAKLTQIATIEGADLIVVTGKFGTDVKNVEGTEIITGMPLFTGQGRDAYEKAFIERLNNLEGGK